MVSVPEYDLVAIGSSPAGQKCAIAGAKLGKTRRGRRPRYHDWRCLRSYRNDPE